MRHGESRAASKENPFPLVDGHGDPELHPNGERQAIAVGERLKDEKIDAIYVTSLQRTVQTAAPLAAHLGMSMRVEADLREVCLGEWEGGVLRMKAVLATGIPAMQAEERWDAIPGARVGRRSMPELPRRWRGYKAHANQKGAGTAAIFWPMDGCLTLYLNGADNGSISRIVLIRRYQNPLV